MKSIRILFIASFFVLAFTLVYGGVSNPPAKVQKLSTGESIDVFSANVKSSTGSLKSDLTTETNNRISGDNDLGYSTGTLQGNVTSLQSQISSNDSDISALRTSTGTLLTKSSATATYVNKNQYSPGLSTGVTKIIAGTNVTISPSDGRGEVTINAAGGGGTALSIHRIAIYGGTGNSDIYNSSDTAYGFGHWFEVCGATGNVQQFIVAIASPTTETPTINVYLNGTSTTTLTIPSGSSPLVKTYATGITVGSDDVIGLDFENVGSNPPGGLAITAILKEQ